MPFDPSTIDDGWSLAAFIVAAIALIWIQLSGRRHAKRAADEIEHQSRPNSGHSLKDATNRLEAGQEELLEIAKDHGQRLAVLERAAEKRRPRGMWRR